jgi:glycosyltransferase involved in cell wall biosynthesis
MENKKKIVYLLPGGLFNSGGMERAITIKANYLAGLPDYDVSIVTTEQMGRPVFYPLSGEVHLYHLDIGIHENFGKESYLRKVISRYFKTKEYRKKLSALLNDLKPDITVSTLGLDIGFIRCLKDGSRKIGELHFPGNFRQLMANKLSKDFISNYVAKLRTQELKRKCAQLDRLVVLTREERDSWEQKANISVIPNPLPFYPETQALLTNKQAIAVGRLAYEKGFDMLIDAWQPVSAKHPDWQLHLFGDGNQKQDLLQRIADKGLEEVIKIHEPVTDIQNRYSEHSMLVFPSRYLDALPMVLIEAMASGLPLVSFNSPCGPKDLIRDGINGYLVQTGDVNALSERIMKLIESFTLRQSMGKAARELSVDYRMETVMQQWVHLFETVDKKKIYINGRFLTHPVAGIPRFSYEMCRAMCQSGMEITVVAPLGSPRKDYPFPVEYYGKKKSHLWEQIDLYRFIKRKNGALLISFSGLGPVLYKNHLPTIHDLSFWRHPEWFSFSYTLIYKILTPILVRKAFAVLTVSQFSKREIIDLLKIKEDKVTVVPNAVSLAFSTEQDEPEREMPDGEERYVLMVSARDRRKNFYRAVQAFLSLNQDNVKLYIVGGSGTVFKEKGLADFHHPSIKLLGRISDEALSFYYRHASLFVYPSLYEGFGLPPIEAMAHGCPVLVSDIEPLREVCGEAACYCNPKDISSIAEGMKTLLEDEVLRLRLVEAGYRQIKNYRWELSVQKMKTCLNNRIK